VNNAGRISQLSLNTGTSVTAYKYDAFQRLRIKTQTSPVSGTHYIWDAFGHIIAEHNATGGGALKQYIWLGDKPLAVFDNTTLYYVHPDHLDRPVAMTNASAMTLAWQARYDPFGNPVTVTVSPVMNMRLPGQWFQIEDGLSYNWHRTYDPGIGRYSQADPLGFVDGPNVYNYAVMSPAMFVDPQGLDQTIWDWPGNNGRTPFNGPRNGNWGGGCWSGGQYSCGNAGMGRMPPTDSGDMCYQKHDECYGTCDRPNADALFVERCRQACDHTLVDSLQSLPADPRNWPVPPRDGTERDSADFIDDAIDFFN
jgi:RHS repeat-associated protein